MKGLVDLIIGLELACPSGRNAPRENVKEAFSRQMAPMCISPPDSYDPCVLDARVFVATAAIQPEVC
ncbi:hypothetical protein AF71_00049750 [Rhizobium sp. 57MFTsu3.2]|nr:hypothetical protein [Rhizobium sp. 57MFTsu3.2]